MMLSLPRMQMLLRYYNDSIEDEQNDCVSHFCMLLFVLDLMQYPR